MAAFAGCTSSGPQPVDKTGMVNKPVTVVGTLPTEDLLPLWVAQEQGIFEKRGMNVEIVQFQSAAELTAGVGSGQVDMVMTDIMVTAGMYAGGIDVGMKWVTLGSDASQGRFGIMAGPDSAVTSLNDLAGVPIGVGSNTILEYVMDCLMADAGVPEDQVVVEEIQKLPVRFQAMMSGQVAAAALPGSLLVLGESKGCRLVADDTQGDNISQSVMVARTDFATSSPDAVKALADAWDEAVAVVNADPNAWRALLVQKANLAEEVADTYPVSTYPTAALPTAEMVEPVLSWMQRKGYLNLALSYDAVTGDFSK